MDRRDFLKNAGVAGLVPATSSAWADQLKAIERFWRSPDSRRHKKTCMVLGIGGAGTNAVLAARACGVLDSDTFNPKFICVDSAQALKQVASSKLGNRPIKTVALAEYGAGGWVNSARVMALRQRDMLRNLLVGADMVVLVAGLGGEMGSRIAPTVALLAREAGIFTVAAAITPFDYETARCQTARTAIRYLRCEADLVMEFSNEDWSQGRDDMPVASVLAALDQNIGERIRAVLDRADELRA